MSHRSTGLRRAAAACLVFAAALPAAATAATPAEVTGAVDRGADWIRTKQDAGTGGLTGFGGDYAISALAAAGVHPADVRRNQGAPSVQDYQAFVWSSQQWTAPTPSTLGAGDFERAILGAGPAGLDPARVATTSNLVAQLAGLSQANGAYGDPGQFSLTVFGLLAMAETPASPALLAETAATVRANQHQDGGWNYGAVTSPEDFRTPSDIDVTGAAIAALCEAGATQKDPAVWAGIRWLRFKLDSATGAFNAQFGPNTDSNAWAVSGLNACGIDPQEPTWTTPEGKTPVDFLVAQQRTSGPAAGSFRYAPGEDDSFVSLFSTQDAVRALAGEVFSAPTPNRVNPSDPRFRARPVVGRGTAVPLTLSVDDGTGDVRLCRVIVPSQSSLNTLLNTAKTAAAPAGCVSSLTTTGSGTVTSINGKQGAWQVALDRQGEARAALQTVRFGQFVKLRLPGAGRLTALPASISFGPRRVGTTSAAREAYVRVENASARLAVTLAGTNPGQFAIVSDACSGRTVVPGAGCLVRVRFTPSKVGPLSAALRVSGGQGVAPATVGLTGVGN